MILHFANLFPSVFVLKLLLPNGYTFNANDFGTDIPFKIYNEDETPFNAIDYTALVHIIDEFGNLVINEITATWITQNQGIGKFAFTQTNRVAAPTTKSRNYSIQIQLVKTGVVLTTEYKRLTFFDSASHT